MSTPKSSKGVAISTKVSDDLAAKWRQLVAEQETTSSDLLRELIGDRVAAWLLESGPHYFNAGGEKVPLDAPMLSRLLTGRPIAYFPANQD
jgi:hypothetical protein